MKQIITVAFFAVAITAPIQSFASVAISSESQTYQSDVVSSGLSAEKASELRSGNENARLDALNKAMKQIDDNCIDGNGYGGVDQVDVIEVKDSVLESKSGVVTNTIKVTYLCRSL